MAKSKGIYLTSLNKDKRNAVSNNLMNKLGIKFIISVESDSGIEGGQPYGLEETKKGCMHRTARFEAHEDFISIENGFVKETDTMWYDIAYIYARIDGIYYSSWSPKRWFPSILYKDTKKLIEYFDINSMSRYEQLNIGVANLSLIKPSFEPIEQ
jgi:non-canonical (house-cleaning) NTP pyrophosphatase